MDEIDHRDMIDDRTAAIQRAHYMFQYLADDWSLQPLPKPAFPHFPEIAEFRLAG